MTKPFVDLGVREREIMEAIYRLGEASVADVRELLEGTPHYSTVRTMMNKLERKGLLAHRVDGPRFLYSAVLTQPEAQRSTMKRMLSGLFEGSTERAIAALLEASADLTSEELAQIRARIDEYGASET